MWYYLIVSFAVRLGLTPYTVYSDVRCEATHGQGVIVCADDGSDEPDQCDLYCVEFANLAIPMPTPSRVKIETTHNETLSRPTLSPTESGVRQRLTFARFGHS